MIVVRALLWGTLVALPAAVWAQEPISSRMDVHRVALAADGSQRLESAAEVKPGDVLEYQIVYDNAGSKPVSDLRINGPVPAGTSYVDGSAKSSVRAQLKFSDDGGRTWSAAPLKRAANIGVAGETVPPELYSNVQWTAQEPLRPGVSQKYTYRVRVFAATASP
jgi:uncharacterized repeat protein (TIGR01451 family)